MQKNVNNNQNQSLNIIINKESQNVMSQTTIKRENFQKQIRMRQRQTIFKNIRKQFQYLYTNNNSHNNTLANNTKQQNHTMDNNHSIQSHKNINQKQLQIEQYPLISKILQKFHQIPHTKIWKHLAQIQQHLIQNNIYLSIYNEEVKEDHFDEQSLLIHDLFYLTLEHSPHFVFPRKFKFVRNGSFQVATYMAIVSNCVMPEQLVYWMAYMSQQDRSFAYINIAIDQMNNDFTNTYKSNHLHYQSWVNHPTLRNYLLTDFPYIQQAARAIKQIVGYRKVHPDRLKNKKGQNLYELLCKMFSRQLQSMKRQVKDRQYDQISHSCSEDIPIKLIAQHIEISVKVIQAKILQNHDCCQLIDLVSKIIRARVQSQIQLISPIFCQWVINAFIRYGYRVLRQVGFTIIIDMVTYDPSKFISSNDRCSQAISHTCSSIDGKVCKYNFNKFQTQIFKTNPKMQQEKS